MIDNDNLNRKYISKVAVNDEESGTSFVPYGYRPVTAVAADSFIMVLPWCIREVTGAIAFTTTFKASRSGCGYYASPSGHESKDRPFRNRLYYTVRRTRNENGMILSK